MEFLSSSREHFMCGTNTFPQHFGVHAANWICKSLDIIWKIGIFSFVPKEIDRGWYL